MIFSIETFNIIPFELHHDVKCYGYLIKDTISNSKILYITDTGEINYDFNDVDYFLIESNCDEEELTYEDYKEVRLYDTHLSMQQTSQFLKNNANYNTKKIILCHISSSEENYLKHKEYVEKGIEHIDEIAKDLPDYYAIMALQEITNCDFQEIIDVDFEDDRELAESESKEI